MTDDISYRIAERALQIGAIKLNPANPFTWASGYRMPIYNDNRRFLTDIEGRDAIIKALSWKIAEMKYDIIAGTSTAGIPWASFLADRGSDLMIYIRDKPKDHGLRNQIEGIDAHLGLQGQDVILIEDLVSTGGSSVKAVQAIRNAGGVIDNCLSIFDYGFKEAREMFSGNREFEEGKRLSAACAIDSVLDYNTLLSVARDTKKIGPGEVKMLEEWRGDPFGWGDRNGFPRVKK